jgi:hypothetical protein
MEGRGTQFPQATFTRVCIYKKSLWLSVYVDVVEILRGKIMAKHVRRASDPQIKLRATASLLPKEN